MMYKSILSRLAYQKPEARHGQEIPMPSEMKIIMVLFRKRNVIYIGRPQASSQDSIMSLNQKSFLYEKEELLTFLLKPIQRYSFNLKLSGSGKESSYFD